MSISSSGWYLLSVTTDCTVSEAQIIWGVPNSEIKYVFKLETDTSTDPLDPVENNTKITNGDWEQVDISDDSVKLCSVAGYWVYIVYSSDDSVTIYERVENWMLGTDEERLNDDMSLWNITYETDLSGLFSPENYDTSNDDLQNALKAFTGNDSTTGGDISNWNTENVTTMANMFKGATNFDGNLSTWTTTNVADMSYMFYEATDFNSDISEWDVHNVTDMSYMFYGATSFTNGGESSECCSKIGCKWNVYNVTNMSYMFYGGTLFNLDIGNWSPESVTNFSYMFAGCTSFDQDLSSYSLTNAEYMEGMLDGCTSFNQDLSAWDVVTISSNDVSATETTNSDSLTFTLTMNYKNVVDDDDYELILEYIDVYLKDLSDSSASFTSVTDTNTLALDSNDSNGQYTLTLTHDSSYENLDYYIQVNVGVISNGNIMTDTSVDPIYYVSSKYEWTYDTRGTTVTISYDTNEITTNNGIDYSTNDTLTFTLTTNENTVKGDTSQIVCTNCTVIGYGETWSDDIDDSNTTYELIVQPTGDGECKIVIQPGVLLNSDGNQNYEVEYSWTQDTSKPTVSITAYETDDTTTITSGSTTEVQTLYVYFEIADIDTTFSDSSITLTGTNGTLTIDTTSTVQNTSANTTTYKAVFQSDSNIATGDTFTVYVEAGVFTDPAGNSNETSNVFQWTYQNPSPTVMITAEEADTNGTTISNYSSTEGQSIYVYFEIDDLNTTFDPTSDITYDSSALTLNYDSSDDVTDTSANTVKYTVTFTAVSVGTFNVSVDENAFQDSDGHGNEGSDVFQWSYGLTSPTVNITATDMDGNAITAQSETYENEIIIKVGLNEINTHFNESHISVSDGTTLSQYGATTYDYINFTFKHTAYKNSTFAVYVNADKFQHENDSTVKNVASNVFTWDYNGIIKFRSSVFRLFYYSTQDDTSSDKNYLTYDSSKNNKNDRNETIGTANNSSNAARFRLTKTTDISENDGPGVLTGRYDYHIKLDNNTHGEDVEDTGIYALRVIDFEGANYSTTNDLNLQIEKVGDNNNDWGDGWIFIYITAEEAADEGMASQYQISNAILRYYHEAETTWWTSGSGWRGTTAIQHTSDGSLSGGYQKGHDVTRGPGEDGTRYLYMEKIEDSIENQPS